MNTGVPERDAGETKEPGRAPTRLPARIVARYAAGSLGTGGFATLPGLVLAYFLTDNLGVAAILAGTIVTLAKIWDVVIDPVIGAWSDRSLGRTGSRKRFMLIGAFTLPVFFALTFAVPPAFGPVAGVIRAKDYDEALELANDTEFGLTAGICTTSLKHAGHFRRNAEAGMVMVNLPTAGVDFHVPFGGRKGSSYGSREQGRYAQEFYTTVKTAYTLP